MLPPQLGPHLAHGVHHIMVASQAGPWTQQSCARVHASHPPDGRHVSTRTAPRPRSQYDRSLGGSRVVTCGIVRADGGAARGGAKAAAAADGRPAGVMVAALPLHGQPVRRHAFLARGGWVPRKRCVQARESPSPGACTSAPAVSRRCAGAWLGAFAPCCRSTDGALAWERQPCSWDCRGAGNGLALWSPRCFPCSR